MKNVFIFILIFHLFGCNNILKNTQTLVDFDCPKVFFSSENRIFIDNSNSLDDVLIRAELNNFSIIYNNFFLIVKYLNINNLYIFDSK